MVPNFCVPSPTTYKKEKGGKSLPGKICHCQERFHPSVPHLKKSIARKSLRIRERENARKKQIRKGVSLYVA